MKTHFLRYLNTGVFELSEITEIIKQQKGYVIMEADKNTVKSES